MARLEVFGNTLNRLSLSDRASAPSAILHAMALGTNRSRRTVAVAIFCLVAALLAGVPFSIHLWRARTDHLLVAAIPATTAQALWEEEHAGIAAGAAGSNWRIYWNGPDDQYDVSQQIALLEHLHEVHVSGIVLTPNHPLALSSSIQRFLDAGIPTVVLSTTLRIQENPRLAYVLNDDAEAGSKAADFVGQLVHGSGKIALVGDDPTIASSTERADAFLTALSQRYPRIEVVSHLRTPFRHGQAEREVEDILLSNPALDAIVSIGIDPTKVALLAVAGSGRRSSVSIVSFDQDTDLLDEVRHGGIRGLIAQDTFRMGFQAMEVIRAAHERKPFARMTRVSPILITAQNMDDPQVTQALVTDWKRWQP